ncbi:prepilin-type N-terminal cleavage/methylation domain-containing protein [Candidatus Uhrbacteria bacterium]|nr:prepilin-type N-terminal cleavage/methylation domain-containing protein [Candidatus Uhrbacteria bacterium]
MQRFVLRKGFTLIELLIVIAVIAILAAVAFVALDPLTRFRDARDARRWSDVSAILNALKADQVDNRGTYLASVTAMTAGQVYMVGTDAAGCDDYNASCDVAVSADANCVNLAGIVTAGKMGAVPTSPNGAGTWTAGHTGYTLQRDATGILTARSCESENTTAISLSR